jgi:hypothetical protein
MPPKASASVRVRAYNVRFGDCVLVSFDAGAGEKHLLFDFGNAPAQVRNDGGKNDVFKPVAADIAKRTNGVIDLLVMSHEHLDHIEGFYSERKVFDAFTVREVWMSAMSEPDYYKRHKKCEPEKRARLALLGIAQRWDDERRFDRLPSPIRSLIANNVLTLANRERIDYLRGLVSKKKLRYLHRGKKVSASVLGAGVSLEILAPEEDASVYYPKSAKPGHSLWLDAAARFGAQTVRKRRVARYRPPRPPQQMPPDEFAKLRDRIGELDMADLLAIDKAANNTSLVVRLTVNGKVLLLPGDAEQESWAMMRRYKRLAPVDLLKLAHHGSVNGMPFDGTEGVLDKVLKPGRKTIALVSTCRGVYGNTKETEIPYHLLMDTLEKKCAKVYVTEDEVGFGEGFDIRLN